MNDRARIYGNAPRETLSPEDAQAFVSELNQLVRKYGSGKFAVNAPKPPDAGGYMVIGVTALVQPPAQTSSTRKRVGAIDSVVQKKKLALTDAAVRRLQRGPAPTPQVSPAPRPVQQRRRP